jgi:hypothetical protein
MSDKKLVHTTMLVILLAAVFSLTLLSIWHRSITYDEPRHLKYGMNVLTGNFDNPESMLPFTALNAIPQTIGHHITRPQAVRDLLGSMHAARGVTVLFSLLLAFYVYKWAKETYGPYGGLFSLLLYVFSPNLTAHAGLVTTDLYAALMITVTTYYFRRFLNRLTWKSAISTSFFLGLSLTAKHTCIFLYPIFIVILLVKYAAKARKEIQKGQPYALKWLTLCCGYFAFVSLFSLLILNAIYLFHGSFMPLGDFQFKSGLLNSIQTRLQWLGAASVPLPAPYVYGWDFISVVGETHYYYGNVYLLGNVQREGFPGYFFVAFLFKEPLGFQILMLISIASYIHIRKQYAFFRDELFLAVPVLFFTIYFNFFFEVQVGYRHFMIILPYLYIFCGSLCKNWDGLDSKLRKGIIMLVVYLGVSVLSYFPHFLSYFNELVWDRKMAYKVLADSNVDWGQSEWYLERYRRDHPDVIINPDSPVAGRIVITINELTGVCCSSPEKYRWLRENFEPVDDIGYSYLVYDVTPESLARIVR